MVFRLNFGKGRVVAPGRGKNRHIARAMGALLGPAALMAYVLGFWSLAADAGKLEPFAISGVFSHWQVWLPIAGLIHAVSHLLNEYAEFGRFRAPYSLGLGASKASAKHEVEPESQRLSQRKSAL